MHKKARADFKAHTTQREWNPKYDVFRLSSSRVTLAGGLVGGRSSGDQGQVRLSALLCCWFRQTSLTPLHPLRALQGVPQLISLTHSLAHPPFLLHLLHHNLCSLFRPLNENNSVIKKQHTHNNTLSSRFRGKKGSYLALLTTHH